MQKFFTVLPRGYFAPAGSRSQAFLLVDNWDDFTYKTTYSLIVFDALGVEFPAGQVKIGQFQMKKDGGRPDIPNEFDSLDENFFSLGQDDSYYETLNSLEPQLRDRILRSLRDVAIDESLFERALEEKVTQISLLRSVSRRTVEIQYSRLARGGARLSSYEFTYTYSKAEKAEVEPATLAFQVEPGSMPPTNIHVLIGRNGVGKTFLLHNMARSLGEKPAGAADFGHFAVMSKDHKDHDGDVFANLVSVTFSAFDAFDPLPNQSDKSEGMLSTYIGLKHLNTDQDDERNSPKSPKDLANEFADSVHVCTNGARLIRWRRALETLETDPIFHSADVANLAEGGLQETELKARAKTLFSSLSSGHKIVLLTITKLVETVDERTLILLDEPEAHLHPPLLSAFVRALSDLLLDRNGVAIIATHSPVVLQEVPKSCVWKIRRSGFSVQADRPDCETFGENVGVLTREVFGLEATAAGFHQLLQNAVTDDTDFNAILMKFDSKLGGEARAHVRAILANRIDREREE